MIKIRTPNTTAIIILKHTSITKSYHFNSSINFLRIILPPKDTPSSLSSSSPSITNALALIDSPATKRQQDIEHLA